MKPYIDYPRHPGDTPEVTVLHAGHFIKASSVDDMDVEVLQYIRDTVTLSAIAKGGVEISYSMTHAEATAFHEALGSAISAAEGEEAWAQEKAYDELNRVHQGDSDDRR